MIAMSSRQAPRLMELHRSGVGYHPKGRGYLDSDLEALPASAAEIRKKHFNRWSPQPRRSTRQVRTTVSVPVMLQRRGPVSAADERIRR